MVRWRYCLVLSMLLLLPTRTMSKADDEEDDENELGFGGQLKYSDVVQSWPAYGQKYNEDLTKIRGDEGDEDDEDDDDDEEEDQSVKMEIPAGGRRAVAMMPSPKTLNIVRTTPKRPLECYVCAYKTETPLRACLDPAKFRVHSITCHSTEEKCFTSIITKGNSYEAVVRGCRTGCFSSPDTTCCENNRCNSQAFAMPVMAPKVLAESEKESSKSDKTIPQTVLFFVTVLLVLQTVVKVAFV